MIFNTKIGGSPKIEALTVTENGTYTAPEGVDGYSPVTVNTPIAKLDFTYTGNYTSYRDSTYQYHEFTTSGTLKILSKNVPLTAYILGGGGGGAYMQWDGYHGSGGGSGGIQTVSNINLKVNQDYPIVLGAGGAGVGSTSVCTGGTGGTTTAFGYTCTGGKGGTGSQYSAAGGKGGTPNGNDGIARGGGGAPNGGNGQGGTAAACNGGPGLVKLYYAL